MGETMIQRRNAIKIIGAALLAPKACFAHSGVKKRVGYLDHNGVFLENTGASIKQLLPETQTIINIVNSWNLKSGKMVRFIVDERVYKKGFAAIILFHEHQTQSYLEFADELKWPIDGADPVVVLKELASYFGGKITCSNSRCYYGLKVFTS